MVETTEMPRERTKYQRLIALAQSQPPVKTAVVHPCDDVSLQSAIEARKLRLIDQIKRGIDLVQHLDPAGIASADLRECLLIQIAAQQAELSKVYAHQSENGDEDLHRSFKAEAELKLEERRRAMEVAAQIVQDHLQLLQKRDVKDLAKSLHVTPEEVHAGVEFIRTLEPRPPVRQGKDLHRAIPWRAAC